MSTSIQRIAQFIMREHGVADKRVALEMARESVKRHEDAQRYAKRREEAQSTKYHDWLRKEFPDFDWDSPVYVKIIEHIQAVLDGDITQLIINIAPRLGKSELVTIRLPAFFMLRNPNMEVMIGAYNKDLAKNFSEESLRIYKDIAPLSVGSSLADEWTTVYGGRVKAVGAGSSAAGFGADCLPAGTMIETEVGSLPIEVLCSMAHPPAVLAYNRSKRQLEHRAIVATRKLPGDTLCSIITSDGKTLRCTPEHRLWSPSAGCYLPASSLENDDELLYIDGSIRTILGMYIRRSSEPVYDIQVEECHNFFAEGLLVHNCLIVDDPIKNYAEAHSPTYQQMVWNWWLNDIRTRRNQLSQTPTILIHTRWTEEDLTGRIKASAVASQWTILSIPAISTADDPAHDPLGRQKGESILPSRMPIQDLITIRDEMGREFEGLYQQNPKSEASYTFKTEKIELVEEVPINCHRVRFFDRAGSEGKGDYTVGVLLAQDSDGFVYIEDIVRGQWAPEDVERQIEQTVKMDAFKYAGRPDYIMQFWIEQEPASSGKQVAYATQRKLAGYEVHIDRPSDNKDVRSRPFATFVNSGNVRMKQGSWNQAFISELSLYIAFGKRAYDDQVDAASGAYMKLTIERLHIESR